jgi:hypothetical protein
MGDYFHHEHRYEWYYYDLYDLYINRAIRRSGYADTQLAMGWFEHLLLARLRSFSCGFWRGNGDRDRCIHAFQHKRYKIVRCRREVRTVRIAATSRYGYKATGRIIFQMAGQRFSRQPCHLPG